MVQQNTKNQTPILSGEIERQIVDGIPIPIFAKDTKSRLVLINKKCEEFWGVDREQLLGTVGESFWRPDQIEYFLKTDRETFEKGNLIEIPEVQSRSAKLGIRLCHTFKIPIYDDNQQPLYLIAVFLDITERVAMERRLKESEERYALLSSLSSEGILIHQNGRVMDCNATLIDMLGYDDVREIIRRDPLDLVAPESRDEAIKQIGSRRNILYELVGLRRDGTRFPAELNVRNIRYQGEEARVVTIRDISKRKEAEEEQKRAQDDRLRLQNQLFHSAKLASIGTLAAGVAHEINNPLTIIKGNSTFLREILKGLGSADAENSLSKITRATDRVASIVQSLRNHAKPDSDEGELVDVHQVVGDTLALLETIYVKDGVAIEKALLAEKFKVQANVGKLQQVLMNLLANAKHATEGRSGGRRIRIETRNEGEALCLVVSDNGVGIEKKNLTRIFDPFFTTKTQGKGMGLGLSISYSIVESFGGSIGVDSEVGIGTTFTVRFPFDAPLVSKAENGDTKQGIILSGHALVVDDEEGIRDLLTQCLTEFGLTVEVAEDGERALEKVRARKFDYILTDIKMPGMTGDQFMLRAKQLPGGTPSKFLVITGGVVSDYTAEQRQIIRAHAVGYLQKPFTDEAIADAMQRLANMK